MKSFFQRVKRIFLIFFAISLSLLLIIYIIYIIFTDDENPKETYYHIFHGKEQAIKKKELQNKIHLQEFQEHAVRFSEKYQYLSVKYSVGEDTVKNILNAFLKNFEPLSYLELNKPDVTSEDSKPYIRGWKPDKDLKQLVNALSTKYGLTGAVIVSILSNYYELDNGDQLWYIISNSFERQIHYKLFDSIENDKY